MAHVRKFWLLPEVSESTAVLSHNLAYAGLIVGAALVFIGTLVLFWADAEIKRHGDARLSANEVETGRAKESAGLANKAAGEANQRAGEANERAAELERQAQELRAKNLLFEAALQPRTLEQSMSVKALRQFAGTEVRVVSPDETESEMLGGPSTQAN